jgi:hypothetical protein
MQLPSHNHLVIFWGNGGNITTLAANWIPPDVNSPMLAAAHPTKKVSSGMQHANQILVKLQVPTDFQGITKPPYPPSNEYDNINATQKTPPNYLQQHPLPKTLNFDIMLWMTDMATCPLITSQWRTTLPLPRCPPKNLFCLP